MRPPLSWAPFAGVQKDHAFVLKQQRLLQEEREAEAADEKIVEQEGARARVQRFGLRLHDISEHRARGAV